MNIELHGGTIIGDIEIEAAARSRLRRPHHARRPRRLVGRRRRLPHPRLGVDLRPGGEWNCRATSAGGDMTVHGVYIEVERPRALAYTWNPSWETDSRHHDSLYPDQSRRRHPRPLRTLRLRWTAQIAGGPQPGLDSRHRMALGYLKGKAVAE